VLSIVPALTRNHPAKMREETTTTMMTVTVDLIDGLNCDKCDKTCDENDGGKATWQTARTCLPTAYKQAAFITARNQPRPGRPSAHATKRPVAMLFTWKKKCSPSVYGREDAIRAAVAADHLASPWLSRFLIKSNAIIRTRRLVS